MIIILFSIIIPQMSVVVLVDTGAFIYIGVSSLHLDNSQLIYLALGYHSSFSDRRHKIHLLSSDSMSSLLDRKHRIHPSSSYFLLFFVPALHHVYCSRLLPCSFSLQVLWDNLDVLQCDSDSFSM